MRATKDFVKNLISQYPRRSKIFKRNLIKEYLQVVILDFIYSHSLYNELIFYGGSCLSHCYGLSRLSEDLDFVDLKRKIDLEKLAKDLKIFFEKESDFKVLLKVQKFRIYLKFPILRELKLSTLSESDFLLLKIEIFKDFDFCSNYKVEIVPLFKFNHSILIKTFDLSTLMTTKIKAILYRKWEKTNKKGKVLIAVKGRDYFDLMWYLTKKITPNLSCLKEFKNKKELKAKLLERIEKINSKSIFLDLENLIDNKNYVLNLSKNIKEILKREIEKI